MALPICGECGDILKLRKKHKCDPKRLRRKENLSPFSQVRKNAVNN
jgi:hypothetical protein